jgi:hypothetical protein
MGWTEHEFYASTPRYFFHAWRAYQKKREVETKERENWNRWHLEMNRQSSLALINLQLEQKDRLTAYGFFPLPWDEKPTTKEPGDATKEAADFIKEKGYDQGIPMDEFFK